MTVLILWWLLPIIVPIGVMILCLDRVRAFFGYVTLFFGGVIALFYSAHLIGIY